MPSVFVLQSTYLSWANPEGARRLGADLARRLERELDGESAVMLSLTYRRRDGVDGRDVYFEAMDQRHVREFIRRLSAKLGYSLTGRWLCKLEFQSDGTPHWHIVIRGARFMKHALVAQCWPHGFVWVSAGRSVAKPYRGRKGVRDAKSLILYLAKYCAKGGQVPNWVLNLQPRSFKVVRVSPGFWRKTGKQGERGESLVECERRGSYRIPLYKPIGARMQESRIIIARIDPETDSVRYRVIDGGDIGDLIRRCTASGGQVLGKRTEADIRCQADAHVVGFTEITFFGELDSWWALDVWEHEVTRAASGDSRRGSLHLKETHNPRTARFGRYVRNAIAAHLEEQMEPAA